MEFVVYNEGIIINCSALIMLPFIVYPSKCHVIITICDVGGGGALLARYENRGTGCSFSFPNMIPVTKSSPPPATGRGSITRSLERPRPLMVVNH